MLINPKEVTTMTFDLVNYGFDPFYDFFAPVSRRENHAISMKTDVKEDDTHYMMDVELPGVKKEDINVTLKDGYLTISAKREDKRDEKSKGKYVCHERTYGSASRTYYVGLTDEKSINAKFENGVLSLVFPKEEEKKELVHNISIN